MRYELEFQLVEQEFTADQVVRTIELVREDLTALTQKDARERHPWASEAFRKTAIKSTGGRPAFIKTTSENSIEVKSGRRGRNPHLPLKDVRSTVLSVYGRSADYPAIAAVRRELSTWKLLGLEPSAMRAPSAMSDPSSVDARGANLPATLASLTQELGDQATVQLEDTLLDLVDVRSIDLDIDSSRQLITLQAEIGNAPLLPARALSDGTLRFIVLGLLAIDLSANDVLCFEEPENGIYPDKLRAMYTLLHELAVDSHKAVGPDNPLQQMIVNSHFPAYLSLHQDNCGELLVAESHPIDNSLRLLPVLGNENWRTTNPGTPGVIATVIEEILHVSLKQQYEVA